MMDERLSNLLSESLSISGLDPGTQKHQHSVWLYAMELAKAMELSVDESMMLASAALFHDIGKLYVPISILHKPGPLTAREYAVIKRHPELGAQALASMLPEHPASQEVCRAVHQHHERWNGTGYPDGLVGDEIHLFARIIGAADTYAAATATVEERPYNNPPKTHSEAIGILQSGAGILFDPRVVSVFVKTFHLAS